MTTIVDPTGSPTIVYNKSGTTIVSVTAGLDQSTATLIPRLSGVTVAIVAVVTISGTVYNNVKLPSDAEIGDVVEVYGTTTDANVTVFPDTGSTIAGLSVNDGIGPHYPGTGFIFRKIGSSIWGAVSS